MKKNELFEMEITGMTAEGNGVGRAEGMAVFVPSAAVGDVILCRIVKVLKSHCFGIIEKLITPSEDRISADCPVSEKCGGCCFRHISYEAECRVKDKIVRDAFVRLGGFSEEDVTFLDFFGCPETEGYRNKAMYPVGEKDGKLICGFYSKRSHRIVPCMNCSLQPKIFSEIAEAVLGYAEKHGIPAYNEETRSGILRHIYLRTGYHSGEIMLCLVVAKKVKTEGFCEEMAKRFPRIKTILLNINGKNTNVILGDKNIVLYGTGNISDKMCGNNISLSPHSFYQVNTAQAERLYGFAKEFAIGGGNGLLLDLYCGAGTIGLSMADRFDRLIGVEVVPQAVENARENARKSGVDNAEFLCGDAGDIAKKLSDDGTRPDVIVVDPPRKGCGEAALSSCVRMSPERIVMISCNPATAARDCAYLRENGYFLLSVRGVDMFPRTGHVETVCLLSKLKSDQHIEVELKTDELDLTSAESKATYDEIKAYVKEHAGLTVSSLNIAQVKQECGIIERENYNKAKTKDSRQPKCTKEKEEAIVGALKFFKMVK
ncbi:MAG: 23S rRNA (uracil(1939)-C(5))-methyltransferase RlmD [Oscillospiraceae bacterium]|nr:23S rRNA (uracil(1939)-C(5))-methyltransferase RlmD [Oscillospiraceae bacterium]